ncbi:MAG: DUF5018 domain-containing protein, partial [Spirochaetaceae bacterium]|nr:DUF5018 domain-containing protein [Spirochaetaceae bacterium]
SAFFVLAAVFIAGCTASGLDLEEILKTKDYVISFSLVPESGGTPVSAVPSAEKKINLALPSSWDITALKGEFALKPGASVEPAVESVANYTNQVEFTVSVPGAEPEVYTVIVRHYSANDKSIRSFVFSGITHPAAVITDSADGNTGTIEAGVPYGTDLTNLSAVVELAADSIDPLPGVARDYGDSEDDVFTVKSEDGESRLYTVTVTELPNTEAQITDIFVSGMTGFNQDGNAITVNLPFGTSVASIAPTFTLSDGASISPNTAQNFSTASDNSIDYTVTAADGTTKVDYTITMNVAKNDARLITGFTVDGAGAAVLALVKTTINDSADGATGTIALELPSGLSTTFKPAITFSGKSLDPAPASTNFSGAQTYTVEADNGSKRIYTVTVSNKTPEAVTLSGVTANGGRYNTATTLLTLNFNKNVTTLVKENITISGGAYTKGDLAKGSGNAWTLGISGGWAQGATVNVSAANPVGYTISDSTKTGIVLNQAPTQVEFRDVTADGSSADADTANLTLVFDKAVTGLASSGITLTPAGGVTGGALTGSGPSYNLAVSGISSNGLVVTVAPANEAYKFSPTTKTVTVFRKPVTVTYKAGGGTGADVSASVVPGESHTIQENTFTAPGGQVFLGWTLDGELRFPATKLNLSQDKTLTAAWTTLSVIDSAQLTNPDLMIKFGIKSEGYDSATITTADVKRTLATVSKHLKTGTANIALGDWIDIRNLKVAAGQYGGGFNRTSDTKLLVVGINSYNGKNGNTSRNHLVFHFEKTPVNYRMNSMPYSASAMRTYITTQFAEGLIESGVPLNNEGIVWTPKRAIGGISKYGGVETIEDVLFIPTRREIKNSDWSGENSGNSAFFSYYNSYERRKNGRGDWWFATTTNLGAEGYLMLSSRYPEDANEYNLSRGMGAIPAFTIN